MKELLSKHVIVPWDYSEHSQAALEATIAMVDSPEQIEVVHVAEFPAVMEPGVVWGTVSEETISKHLAEAFERVRNEVGFPAVKFTIVFGDPGTELAAKAKSSEAGLIVISSHGRTGISRILLGSVAERVVRLAPCPVLVLRQTLAEA